MSSDIDQLRAKLNREVSTFNKYIQLTNRTIEVMQQSDSLLLKKLSVCLQAIEEFTEQIALQQRQIRDLKEIIRVLSLGTHPVPPEPSISKPSPEQSNIEPSRPSSDEPAYRGSERVDRRSDASDGSNT